MQDSILSHAIGICLAAAELVDTHVRKALDAPSENGYATWGLIPQT